MEDDDISKKQFSEDGEDYLNEYEQENEDILL